MFCAETILTNIKVLESMLIPSKRITPDLFLSDFLKLIFIIGDTCSGQSFGPAFDAFTTFMRPYMVPTIDWSFKYPRCTPAHIRLVSADRWAWLMTLYTDYDQSKWFDWNPNSIKTFYRLDFKSPKCSELVSTGSLISEPAPISDVRKLVKLYGDAVEYDHGIYIPRRVYEEKSSEWKNLD